MPYAVNANRCAPCLTVRLDRHLRKEAPDQVRGG
jgi:hypothetical protein